MRAFLQLRAMLGRKIKEMEKRYDARFHAVFATLRQTLDTPIPPKRQIGSQACLEPLRQSAREA